MFRLKKFPQVWISAAEPYEISKEGFPYRDTWPFFRAVYEEFGGKHLIWRTGYPRPRWELPMDRELAFVDSVLDFYTAEDRELILGKNALRIWKFPMAIGSSTALYDKVKVSGPAPHQSSALPSIRG